MARRIALLIGNSKYDDHPKIPNLETPNQNVRDLERILKHPERCGFDEVTILTDASKSNAERQIYNLFKDKDQDDFLVFYFTGHGLKDSVSALYFAMKETEQDNIEVTAVSAWFVKSCIDKSGSERIVVILDCCYSGAFADSISGYGRVVLTATDAIQYAWERNTTEIIGKAENSAFTRYLVEGIETGEADSNGTGEITIDELFTYAYEQTVKTTTKQTPMKKGHQLASGLVFAKNPMPNRLSSNLLSGVRNPDYLMRLLVADELEERLYFYDGQNPQLVDQILALLKQLFSDHNKKVSERARAALEAFSKRDITPSDDVKRLKLFISSPSDVEAERQIVRRVVEKLNKNSSIGTQAQISTVVRDNSDIPAPLFVHATPPANISNEEILYPSACDIVVVIFRSLIGLPLPTDLVKEDGTRYESGTEWEYENAINGAKRNNGHPIVLVYRHDQPIFRPSEENRQEKLAQIQKVERFFAKFSDIDGALKGGYDLYSDLDQFEAMLEKHLRAVIRKLVIEVPLVQTQQPEREEQVKTLGKSAANELCEIYLNWIIEQHSLLKLRGLGGDARLPTIPLEEVYVALKGNRTNTYEREQAQELLAAEKADLIADFVSDLKESLSIAKLTQIMSYAERQAIVSNPYMPSLMERDLSSDASITVGEKASVVTLGEAFRKERWMVILGDPGSGKTTLARWIALKLAAAWLNNEDSVNVYAYQVDPKVDKSDKSKINIGPVRLPVLLRVSEFAEAYQSARHNLATLSIADFLGYHSWLGESPNIAKPDLNVLIKGYLRLGRVVVILDGMDEITEAKQRDDVVRSIETFIKDWINARGNEISTQKKAFLWDPIIQGEPATNGGNQIIITSRIAGYHSTPITGQITHVTIQPMQQIAVEHFCDAWTLAVHQQMNPNDKKETTQKKAEKDAAGLKTAIFDPHRPRVRELASNPLLITILALVYRNNQGRLPEQRVELYQKALEILIETWRITSITTIELVYVLSPLAAHIHQRYATGLIEESEMKQIIRDALAQFRQLDIRNLPPAFALEVDNFIRRVQEEVGLLTERSKQIYGFLHLTFQEYLAALYLIRDQSNAPQAIIDKLDDPRWREPILMALGHISVNTDWGPEDRQNLLITLLDADDPLGDLIPRSALLIVSAIPEMIRVSEDVVREIIRRLLTTYTDRAGIGQFITLRERISTSFKNLYKSDYRQLLEEYLAEAILDIGKDNKSLGLASATLVAENEWQGDPLLKALIKAFPYDDEEWEYPITRTLNRVLSKATGIPALPEEIEMVQKDSQELERLKKVIEEDQKKRLNDGEAGGEILATAEADIHQIEGKYHERIAEYNRKLAEHEQRLRESQSNLAIYSEMLPFRKHLEDEPDLVDYIKSNLPWLRLIALLYGGISDNGFATYVVQYGEISAVLQLDDDLRSYHIAQLRERDYWRESWDNDDVVYNLAVYLDKECGEFSKKAAQHIPQFSSLAILNDSPFTFLILQALRQKKHPSTLKNRLWQEWRTASQEMRRVHALLALLVIDTQSAIDTLTQSLKDTTTSALAELVLHQLRLRKHTLANSLILLGNKAEVGQSLKPLQDRLEDDQWGDMVEVFFRTFTSVMPLPVGYDNVLLASTTSIPRINAEIWAYWLSGFDRDDARYRYTVILDTIGKQLKSASALVNIQLAHNIRYDKLTHWHSLSIPLEYDNYADVVGEALTIAHQSSSEVMKDLFYVGTMAFTGVNYQEYPGLKEDVLAATLLIPFEFQKDVIDNLELELSQVSTYELNNQIIERVVSIADDVIRSRALWRVAQYRDYWKSLNLWDLSIEAAERIDDPLHRSRACERLINYVPQKQSDRLKNEALEAARKISDPNNRARALARLALYESNEKRWLLLLDALTSVKETTNEQLLVETIQLLHPHLVENHQLRQMYGDIVKTIKSDWYRNKGSNLLSMQLLALHDQLYQPQKLTPVILASLIDEIVGLKPQETDREDLWSQLLDPAKREYARLALLKTISAYGLEGLYLTRQVFDVIDSLLNSQEISVIDSLLPYLRGVEPSLLPLLNLWVHNLPDKMVWAYVGLLLAEAGQVDPYTIPCLIELIESGVDFGRYRASIVLHGSSVFYQKENRDFRTSQLGEQSLLLLTQAQKQLLAERVAVATPIGWTWHNIIHDDPLVFQQLIRYSDTEEGNEGSVLSLLRQISYCDDDVLDAIVTQFEEGSEKTQEPLLNSWIILSKDYFKTHITSVQKERMGKAILKLPGNILESFRVIPERLNTISNILRLVGNQIEEKKITFQEATSVLNQELSAQSLRLPDASIGEITKHSQYHLGSDPQRALDVAQAVSENGTSLELLFAWLAACLRESIDDFPPLYYRASTLLELAGAATHFSPAAVYNLCEKNELGQSLVQATMYHQTFWGRAGAAKLLGYFRQTPESFDEALLSGLQDVAEVQMAIVQMAQNLRYLDERMIPKMIDLLGHESASVVYTISRLLLGIARNEKIKLSLRQEIVRVLNNTIQQRDSLRPVFILEKVDASIFIRNIGRLDQQLYSAIINIIGIA